MKYYEMLTENFVFWEYFVNQGKEVFKTCQPKIINNIKSHSKKLQAFRDYKKQEVYITSGFRTSDYNKKVGGVKGSFHLYGQAADITYDAIAISYKEDFKVLCSIFDGVIYYPNQYFFHCDIGGRKFHSITGP